MHLAAMKEIIPTWSRSRPRSRASGSTRPVPNIAIFPNSPFSCFRRVLGHPGHRLVVGHQVVHGQAVTRSISVPSSARADSARSTIGSIAYGAQTAMMWNLAANAQNGPLLPGSDSCPGGCRPMVTVSGGQYTLNQECAHGALLHRGHELIRCSQSTRSRMRRRQSSRRTWAARLASASA
jgi:hypothetical protein